MKKCLCLLLAFSLVLALLPQALAADTPAELTGMTEAVYFSKYGNVPISVTCEEILAAGYEFGDVLQVEFLGNVLELPLCSNFSDVDSGAAAVFVRDGETYVLLAVNMGDFATTYGIASKTTNEDNTFSWEYADGVTGPLEFTISLKEAGGYYEEYVLHELRYTDERDDYPDLSDEQFANFRMVSTTGMGEGVLFRSSSPLNPEHGRNTYADDAMRRAGVTVVMNLANDEATAAGYEGFEDSYYASVRSVALNMGVDFASSDFQAKLADGLRFLAANPGVYAVHCNEGKDRSGFVSALLECLMGASLDEVAADYMATFYNYYGVTEDDARYAIILESNIFKTLRLAFGGSDEAFDLASADLAACAEVYIKDIGVSDEELAALKKNLSAAPAPAEPEPETETAAPAAEDTTYVVIAGDCLWKLAKRYYGAGRDYGRIAEANGIRSPYVIYVGQTLLIPA